MLNKIKRIFKNKEVNTTELETERKKIDSELKRIKYEMKTLSYEIRIRKEKLAKTPIQVSAKEFLESDELSEEYTSFLIDSMELKGMMKDLKNLKYQFFAKIKLKEYYTNILSIAEKRKILNSKVLQDAFGAANAKEAMEELLKIDEFDTDFDMVNEMAIESIRGDAIKIADEFDRGWDSLNKEIFGEKKEVIKIER